MKLIFKVVQVAVDKRLDASPASPKRQRITKRSRREVAAISLQFFKDTPKDYDAWNIDPGTLDVPPTTIDQGGLGRVD